MGIRCFNSSPPFYWSNTMSFEDDGFEDIVKDLSNNWLLHTKAYETLRAINRAAWYMHEVIELIDDPEEEVNKAIIESVTRLEECADEFIELMDEEYEMFDEDEDENDEDI